MNILSALKEHADSVMAIENSSIRPDLQRTLLAGSKGLAGPSVRRISNPPQVPNQVTNLPHKFPPYRFTTLSLTCEGYCFE
jgi:hypothetical protein